MIRVYVTRTGLIKGGVERQKAASGLNVNSWAHVAGLTWASMLSSVV